MTNITENKNTESVGSRFRVRLIDCAVILEGILCGLILFTQSFWLIAPLIVVAFLVYKHKAKTKKETERQESISNQAFAFGLLTPAIVLMVFFVWLLVKLVPVILQNWQ